MSVEQFRKDRGKQIAELVGNPIVFLQISTLKKLFKSDNPREKEVFDGAINAIAREYFFIGELLVDLPQRTIEKNTTFGPLKRDTNANLVQLLRKHFREEGKTTKRIGIDIPDIDKVAAFHILDKIDELLAPFGLKIGALSNYNISADCKAHHETSIGEKYGTARRDQVRQLLAEIFSNGEPVLFSNNSLVVLNEGNSLTVKFNFTKAGRDFSSSSEVTAEQLAEVTNGSLKRVIRREALLQFGRHDTDSEKAISKFDSPDATSFQINGHGITVTVPLNNKVKGSFDDGDIDEDRVVAGLRQEVSYNLRLAAALN